MKHLYLAGLLALLLAGGPARAQWQPTAPLSADYLTWSARRRLQASDFQFRARAHSNLHGCVGNFGLLTRGNGLDLLGKKGNAVVQNVLYRAGSYLDSASQPAVALQLVYLQTLWDIDEVAARRLRQALRGSAKRALLWGRAPGPDPMQTAYEAASKRQLQYADETNYGLFLDKQAEWEKRLAAELAELQAYALPE